MASGQPPASVEVDLQPFQLGPDGLRLAVNDDGSGQRRLHECAMSDDSVIFATGLCP